MKRLIYIGIIIVVVTNLLCGCTAQEQLNKHSALYRAIDHDNLEEINEALAAGEDINKVREGIRTINPYTFAIEENLNHIAAYLINRGADVNSINNHGRSLLMLTAKENQLELCTLLLNQGAKVELKDNKGNTALEYACLSERGSIKQTDEMIKLLTSHGCKVTPNTLEVAIKGFENERTYINMSYGSLNFLAKTLRESGEESNLPPLLEHALLGETAEVDALLEKQKPKGALQQELIFLSAAFGKPSTLSKLKAQGISLTQLDKHKNTLLHVAARYGNKETLEYLLETEKWQIEENIERYLPLDEAILAGNKELVSFLIEKGMLVDDGMYERAASVDLELLKLLINCRTPDKKIINYCLNEAVDSKKWETASWLIRQGADVNFVGKAWSILENACKQNNLEGVQFLVSNGANVDGPEGEGGPLIGSTEYGTLEMTRYLLSEGADINAVHICRDGKDAGKSYESALDRAIWQGNMEQIKLLLSYGADIEYRNEFVDGNTPLLMATIRGSTNVVAYLLEQGADKNAKNTRGETALDIAQRRGHEGQVALLTSNK